MCEAQTSLCPSMAMAFATMIHSALPAGCHQSSRQDRRMERHDITGSAPHNATPLAEIPYKSTQWFQSPASRYRRRSSSTQANIILQDVTSFYDPFRLKREVCDTACFECPFGLTMMPTQIILDHWNPSKVKWRFETHCYGPWGCPRYKAGPAYRVPGRSPGMVYVDDDVEREMRGG